LPARGLFNRIVELFRQRLSSLPDKRTGKNHRYGMEDAALSAFSVFFTQPPSFLAYQRMMEGRKGKSNAQSLFGVHQIPSDNQIRNLLDPVPPEQVFPVFEDILQVLEQQGSLKGFRFLADTLLVALDGTEYFRSSQIHCASCSTRTLKTGETHDFHSVVTPLTLPGLKARGFSVRWVPIGIALTELLVRVPHGCKSSIPHDLSGGYISISGVAALRALMNSN
jgi:hypothetical protein